MNAVTVGTLPVGVQLVVYPKPKETPVDFGKRVLVAEEKHRLAWKRNREQRLCVPYLSGAQVSKVARSVERLALGPDRAKVTTSTVLASREDLLIIADELVASWDATAEVILGGECSPAQMDWRRGQQTESLNALVLKLRLSGGA